MTYKAGDEVVVRQDLQYEVEYAMFNDKRNTNIVTERMMALAGQKVIIEEISYSDQYKVKGVAHLYWTDEMFSGLARNTLSTKVNQKKLFEFI